MASTISAGTTTTTALVYSADTSGVLQFQTNGTTTALTIDTSQRVGIGTSSPSRTLQVIGTVAPTYSVANDIQLLFSTSTTATNIASTYGSTGSFVPLTFSTNSATQMTLDTSGNLGLGVTPSAWRTDYSLKALQVGPVAAISSLTAGTTNNQTFFSSNLVFGSGGTYSRIYADWGMQYEQTSGQHIWSTTSTQTGSVSLSQLMTLDNSGNLIIGDTSSGSPLRIYRSSFTSTSQDTNTAIALASNGNGADINIQFTDRVAHNTWIGNAGGYFYVQPDSAGVKIASGATSWQSNSDITLKNVTGTYTQPLTDIAQIQAIKFTWKDDTTNKPQVGVSAQSVKPVIPEAVDTDANGILGVRYTELIPLMIASIQALTEKVTALEAKVGA